MRPDPDLSPAVDPVSAILETVTVERDTARMIAVALEQQLADADSLLRLLEAFRARPHVHGPLSAPVAHGLAVYLDRWPVAGR